MSLRRTLGVIALVYVVEGWPMGVFRDVWPVYFRDHGVSLQTIGYVSGLYIAWSLKVLWSPLVDRFGERRSWITGALLVMAAALAAMAWRAPQPDALLWLVLAVFCAASATQDVAIDAYTIGLVARGEEGPANAVRIAAYRVGLLAAGGGLLLLPSRAGWPATWGAAALVALVFAVSVRAAPRAEVPPDARRDLGSALRRWISRPGARDVLLFVLLYRIGDLAMAPMLKPFWVDRGASHDEIALVSTTLGMGATIAGAAVGGLLVARRGIGSALVVVGILALASNLGYALAAAAPGSGAAGLYSASLVESASSGLASAAFLAFLMRICEKEHAAVQYAALTALYALPGTVAGALSGRAVELAGYASYFAATAVLALPAFLVLPRARAWLDDD
ncbi:MAG TPA: MFS transporter [Myxococcota bacterium]|nr:MFS transporter [Myxococcota bacterium]